MSKHARDRRPYIKPVTRVELSHSNIRFRWIAIAVLLSIAVVAIGYGFSLALSTEPGWQQVRASGDQVNCSGDFVLMYDFGIGDVNPTATNKKLEILYTQLTEDAYRIFSAEAEGTDNLYHLNANVNETVTVDPGLYRALEQIVEFENRHVFLAPATALYAPVFLSSTDAEAAVYDPMKEPELAELAAKMAAFGADTEMISLELQGENRVKLKAADAYLAFAEEYGIETFLDFGWMRNAFIVDYMAQALEEAGFAYGYLASYDGFTRNLYVGAEDFSQNIYHCVDNGVFLPAVLTYSGPMSLVSLRSYPLSDQDRWHYYAYEDGSITTAFLDSADGLSKSSVDGLTAYSRDRGCADILLQTAPLFVADSFDAQALEQLAWKGIESVRCHDKGVVITEESAAVTLTDDDYRIVISQVKP